MTDFFATPGMTVVTVFVIVAEVLSLLIMWGILFVFRRTLSKQYALLGNLHDAPPSRPRHVVLAWIYILMTLGIGSVSASLFAFQPHIL